MFVKHHAIWLEWIFYEVKYEANIIIDLCRATAPNLHESAIAFTSLQLPNKLIFFIFNLQRRKRFFHTSRFF